MAAERTPNRWFWLNRRIKRIVAYYKRKFGTNDPLKIAQFLKIQVYFCPLGNIAGNYVYIHRVKWIFVNSDIEDDIFRQVVLAHELGHAILHPKENCAFMAHHTLLLTSRIERQANIFAAHLLISDDLLMEFSDFTHSQFCDCTVFPEVLLNLRFIE